MMGRVRFGISDSSFAAFSSILRLSTVVSTFRASFSIWDMTLYEKYAHTEQCSTHRQQKVSTVFCPTFFMWPHSAKSIRWNPRMPPPPKNFWLRDLEQIFALGFMKKSQELFRFFPMDRNLSQNSQLLNFHQTHSENDVPITNKVKMNAFL